MSCGAQPGVQNGRATTVSPLFYQDSVTVTCHAGHKLVDGTSSITRLCQADKTLSAANPVCKPISCPTLPLPQFSSRSTDDVLYGAAQVFTCNRGYNISEGSRSIRCQANKTWSGVPVTCTGKFCMYVLTHISNTRSLLGLSSSESFHHTPSNSIIFLFFL